MAVPGCYAIQNLSDYGGSGFQQVPICSSAEGSICIDRTPFPQTKKKSSGLSFPES